MITSLLLFWKNQWRQDFPSRFAFLGFALGMFLEVLVYWYTSKAFGQNLQNSMGIQTDYFHYIILGELVLSLPMAATSAFVTGIRDAHAIGVFEPFLLMPWHPLRTFFQLSAIAFFTSVLQLILFTVMALAFGFRMGAQEVSEILLFQVLTLPCFLALGLCIAAIYLRYQRGLGALGFLTKGSAILAGVYFPTTLFPEVVKNIAVYLSPFNALLEASRIMASHTEAFPWMQALTLAVWAILLWVLAPFWIHSALRAVKKRGSIEIIPSF